MNVYVASSVKNVLAVRRVQDSAVAHGHTVTHDWTAGVFGDEAGPDAARAAEACLYGVGAADVVVVLSHPDMFGTMVEVGYALGLGKQVMLVGSGGGVCVPRESVFFSHSLVRRCTIADVIEMFHVAASDGQ